ncbi:hypothetical protein EDC04DRAFT_2867574 [Pisolithus marmoratus]|nr:hypothetical protein EDC04DRAFT_2867574 [Pisolithus marmoratus]
MLRSIICHAGQPCDASGDFLPTGTQLEPHQPKPPNNWSPYSTRLKFKLADFIYMHNQMSAGNLNILLDLWAASLVEAGGHPIFSSHTEMYQTIDSTQVRDVKWQFFAVKYTGDVEVDPAPWMHDEYDIWFWDPHKVIQNMLANPEFAKEMDYQPFPDIIAQDVDCLGSTFVPITLGSDKTTVSVATRQNDYYPLYLSIGNIHNNVHQAHCNGVTLITFLAMPKTTREHAGKDTFHKFQCQLFHSSLGCILKTFKPSIEKPEVIPFGDGHHQHVIYGIGPYIADYEEQALLTCIVCNRCPQCLAYHNNLDKNDTLQSCHDHTELLIAKSSLATLWDEYGIVGELIPFTNDFLHADIYELITPNLLHQIIKGVFKDHLVEWVEKYLIAAVTPFPGLQHFPQECHFKQWMGDDLKALMKVYLPAIEGHVPKEIVCTFHVLLEFCYLIQKNHAVKHYKQLIQLFGAPNGLCSSITKLKHVKAVKKPYQHTNKYHTLDQMLLINQQLDKLAVSQADFDSRGMLQGTCLLMSQGDYEEVSGPRVKVHHNQATTVVALAGDLCIPNLPELVCAFLVGQLYPDDNCDPADISHLECPGYEGQISICNSASLTFYALHDLSGIGGMHQEYICTTPAWRQEGPRYDCVFVMTGLELEGMHGMHGMDIARVLHFCLFKSGGIYYPCAVMHWFHHIGDEPDETTGMWMVCLSLNRHDKHNLTVIHVGTIFCAVHLIPMYGQDFMPQDIAPCHSYDTFHSFYVNKFADHHAFKVAY